MSDRENVFEQQAEAAQGWLGRVEAVLTDAAAGLDAGDYSLDERIKAMHRLFNLQIDGWVAFAQLMVSGPWWRPRTKPLRTQQITVEPDHKFAREFVIRESFTRLSPPPVKIPDALVEFEPEYLAASSGKFTISVRDDSYRGRTYRGVVELRRIESLGGPSKFAPTDPSVIEIPLLEL